MKRSRRHFMRSGGAAAVLHFLRPRAFAQAYPSRPVRVLVGFAAGGNFDVVARLIGQAMSERLGQPFVIENRPGASSNLAAEAAVRSSPDGHTLLLGGAVNAINATLFERLSFDFIQDLAPVAGVIRFPNVVTVEPSCPATTIPEFIAYARANPGKINHGSSGNGTTQHLAGELFKTRTGVTFTHVPYRGASQAVTDLLGGQVQVLFEPLPVVMEHLRSGKLRGLAVTTATRSESLPDLPTVAEFLPGYEASGWTGLCAPKATPVDIVETLSATALASLADPKLAGKFKDLGGTIMAIPPAELGALIASETAKWAQVIRSAGLKAA